MILILITMQKENIGIFDVAKLGGSDVTYVMTCHTFLINLSEIYVFITLCWPCMLLCSQKPCTASSTCLSHQVPRCPESNRRSLLLFLKNCASRVDQRTVASQVCLLRPQGQSRKRGLFCRVRTLLLHRYDRPAFFTIPI